MKYTNLFGSICVFTAVLAGLTGCSDTRLNPMVGRGRVKPLQGDGFFADGSSARPPVPGTVPREDVRRDTPFYTGRALGGAFAAQVPVPVDDALLAAGRGDYAAYCAVCHGADGEGDGIVVRRGFTKPHPFSAPHLLAVRPGYLFGVMTNGFGVMDTSRDLVDENGRWAIAAYIKNILQKGGAAGQR